MGRGKETFKKAANYLPILILGLAAAATSSAAAQTPQGADQTAPPQSNVLTAQGTKLLIDDFESGKTTNTLGGRWSTDYDKYNLGTTLSPNPFTCSPHGVPASPRFCARIQGALGKAASSWPWASLSTDFNTNGGPADLSGYTGVQFYAKGDAHSYAVQLRKASVTDYANFRVEFTPGDNWKLIRLPFTHFTQPSWTKNPAPSVWNDVIKITFTPSEYGKSFDLSIDELALYK